MDDAVLWLLAIQGIVGAFDTLYFHEWRAQLPARVPTTAPELKIHAIRDFLYALLFTSLGWLTWGGIWAFLLGAILLAEIALTLTDFVVEKSVRRSLGDVFSGERVTHAVMGIIYGAMLAHLLPVLDDWRQISTSVVFEPAGPVALRFLLTTMAVGVFVSGLRDLYAAAGLPNGGWPHKHIPEVAVPA